MLVFFSGRRLKPGTWEEFREAWSPGDGEEDLPAGVVAVYHARNLKDPDEVISFGIFEGDADAAAAIRGDQDAELRRQDAMANFVHDIPLEGVYEVIEEIKP